MAVEQLRPGLVVAVEPSVIQDLRPLYVRERRFVLHQDREDIAAGRICNATRVRSYVTLSGVRVTVPGVKIGYVCRPGIRTPTPNATH